MEITEIFETVRPAYLYHSAPVERASPIMRQNKIEAMTTHAINVSKIRKKDAVDNNMDSVKGVSLTRSLIFARMWRKDGVIFVLDQQKLKKKYRILQIDYYEERSNTSVQSEAEEFVIGSIEPLSSYLVKILLSRDAYEWMLHMGMHKSIYGNPKLEIQGKTWQNGLVVN